MQHIRDWRQLPAPEAIGPAPARLLGPAPVQMIRNLLASADGRFHVGEWSSEPGAWRVAYTEHEFCHLLEGVVRLRDEAGNERIYRAGDSFVISPGYTGSWEVLEACRKAYAIYE